MNNFFWKMGCAAYTSLGFFWMALWAFILLNIIPKEITKNITKKDYFKINYNFFLNIVFILISGILAYVGFIKNKNVKHHKEMAPKSTLLKNYLNGLP